jgi:hypothetical protein
MNATTVDEFIAALPDWKARNKIKPSSSQESEGGESSESKGGRNYTVIRTNYSITETPEEIVTYQPVNGFWLGSLVQGQGLRQGIGSMQEIAVPADKRAGFKISTDLPMTANFRTIDAPSTTSASSALGSLMQAGKNTGWGGARTIKIVDNYSESQVAQELGLSARYMTASLKASLAADRFNSKHTVTAAFIERAFTAQADFEGRSRRAAFFNDAFTIDDAHELVNQKRITVFNLPTYIKSVTYGRIVIFNLTSTLSEEQMRAALEASVNTGAWSVDVNGKHDSKTKNAQFELRVTQFGGPQNGFSKLVPASGIENVLSVMNSYLQQPASLTTMMPISYTANTVRDDQLAALSSTTKYTVTKYIADPLGDRLRIKMWVDVTGSDDGVADNTVEVYGTLRVNGETWWEIDREQADTVKREDGQAIEISEDAARRKREFNFDWYYDGSTPFAFDVRLRDKDDRTSDDDMGMFSGSMNLHDLIGTEKTWDWNSDDGEATKLHLKVERTDYL